MINRKVNGQIHKWLETSTFFSLKTVEQIDDKLVTVYKDEDNTYS